MIKVISIRKPKQLTLVLVFLTWLVASDAIRVGEDLLSCEATSGIASGYRCNEETGSQGQCNTFAVLISNSYYSSLSNLSTYLGIDRFVIAEANGFSSDTDFLPSDQPFLIPIECKCGGTFFEAKLDKITTKGESFYHIAESLEGLTTCKAIREKNPSISPWNLAEKAHLIVPLRCACPSSVDISHKATTKILITYPIQAGDTIANIANKFNATQESIILSSNRTGADFKPNNILPFSTVLIPLEGKPVLGSLAKPLHPSTGLPYTGIPTTHGHKRRPEMWKTGIYIVLSGVAFAVSSAIAAAFLIIQWRKKKTVDFCKTQDLEMQQLSLSVRTISDKKVSFEGSQDALDGQILDTTPHKMMVETYTIEQLKKATEDFSSANLIEGSVFHGRLDGKNLAIKQTQGHLISKIDMGLFYDAIHHHPNIIRFYGTCVPDDDTESYMILEYAKNGSLKDWLHGGLAMKSHFIASCYCFLTWNQRLKICLDIATALQFMHHIMSPGYVHRNIKSRNIFLDEEFNAKVGNFGMARCVEDEAASEDQDCHSTSQLASWSRGYLAPEYLHHGVISPGLDIFAYGVVLLEILSGRTAITWANEKGEKNVRLSEKIKVILEAEKGDELRQWMDNAIGDKYSVDTAIMLANLARACVEDDPSLRPNAGEVVERLSRVVEDLPEGSDQFIISESSCKPLVMAASNNNDI
ncbi:hypothetical protein Leryth_017857 [Lithospermum erythrorhizon]|nr:hypothetical protein Leryth_017857 [Lithospermum erythrorhizon]